MKNIFRKVSLPAVLVLSLAIGFAGLTYAAIPDSQGVIHGCYRTSGLLANGQMRIIDSDSQTCNSNETEITWNQTGPQGPPGPTGTGEMITNRIEILAGTASQEIFSVPDFGIFTGGCTIEDNGRGIFFQNTTPNEIFLDESHAEPNVIQPGETIRFELGSRTVTMGYGTGSGMHTAVLVLASGFQNFEPFTCTFNPTAFLNN